MALIDVSKKQFLLALEEVINTEFSAPEFHVFLKKMIIKYSEFDNFDMESIRLIVDKICKKHAATMDA